MAVGERGCISVISNPVFYTTLIWKKSLQAGASRRSLVNRKPIGELERRQTILEILHDGVHALRSVHARPVEHIGRILDGAGAAEETQGLAPVISVGDDLRRSPGREERVLGGGVEEGFSAVGHDDAVEGDGFGSGVDLVDAFTQGLGDDGCVDLLLGEGLFKGGSLLEGILRREDTDVESSNGGKLVAEDAEASSRVIVIVSRVSLGSLNADGGANTDRNVVADLVELLKDVLLDLRRDLGRLEADGVDEELLLNLGQGVEEQTGLGPVIGEGLGALADQIAIGLAVGSSEETAALFLVSLLGVALVQGVWRV